MIDLEYLCTKAQKSLTIYSLFSGSNPVTLSAMNSTLIFMYTVYGLLFCSGQLDNTQSYTLNFLGAFSLRMPKHLASTGKYFNYFLLQKEN